MTRIYYLIFATILTFTFITKVQALKFIEKGKSWHRVLYTGLTLETGDSYNGPDVKYDLHFNEDCDTIINGITYQRLTYQNVVKRTIPYSEEGTTYAILREEDGKVYQYDKSKEKEILLYDFTVNKGDKFQLQKFGGSGYYSCKVEDVSNIKFQDTNLKVITISSVFSETDDKEPVISTWLEGIGGNAPVSQPTENNNLISDIYDITAYLKYKEEPFIPLPIYLWHWQVQGDFLPTYMNITEQIPKVNQGIDNITYELTYDGRLHIHGIKWSMESPYQYLWLLGKEQQRDTYLLQLTPETVGTFTEKEAAYSIDLYYNLPEYDSNTVFYINDNQGQHKLICDPTYIRNINTEKTNDEEIHDISGKKLSTIPDHGITIINGKKIIIK